MLPATSSTSKPASRSVAAASASFSGRRAASVRPYPSSPSMRAIANPIPLEAPVTRAARSGMGESNLSRCSAAEGGRRIKAGRASTYDRSVPFAIVV